MLYPLRGLYADSLKKKKSVKNLFKRKILQVLFKAHRLAGCPLDHCGNG